MRPLARQKQPHTYSYVIGARPSEFDRREHGAAGADYSLVPPELPELRIGSSRFHLQPAAVGAASNGVDCTSHPPSGSIVTPIRVTIETRLPSDQER
jgi:hypothetical protein